MHIIYNNILDKVKQTISQYSMFHDDHVYVALSGGKDSTLLCVLLKALGYSVTAITLDVGYNSDWNELKRNVISLGIDSIIINYNSSELTDTQKNK